MFTKFVFIPLPARPPWSLLHDEGAASCLLGQGGPALLAWLEPSDVRCHHWAFPLRRQDVLSLCEPRGLLLLNENSPTAEWNPQPDTRRVAPLTGWCWLRRWTFTLDRRLQVTVFLKRPWWLTLAKQSGSSVTKKYATRRSYCSQYSN